MFRFIYKSISCKFINLFFFINDINLKSTLFEIEFELINDYLQSQGKYLLPHIKNQDSHKACLVIDLDETLVHSSFKVSVLISLIKIITRYNY